MESSKHTLSSIGVHTARHSSRQEDSKAESALSVLRGGTMIDLVISDYQMPGLDALSLMPLLRKSLPNVPVIVLAGNGSEDSYIKAGSLGAFEYPNKPIRACELARIVKVALETKRGINDGHRIYEGFLERITT